MKNREIKFRVFDNVDYLSNPFTLSDIIQRKIGFTDDCIVEQFTGLIDKNSKDIYEGDVVRILYTDWGSKTDDDPRTLDQYLKDIASIGVVEFNNSAWEVFFKSDRHEYFDGHSSIYPGKHGYVEVIGNIHENPELL